VSALRIGLVLVLAVAAAAVANVALLGVASGDPVGRLSPQPGVSLPVAHVRPRTVVAPPPTGRHHDRREDD